MNGIQRGQVLVFFAFVLPLVLLPVAAYAVDASTAAATFARLQEVTARAAEEAAQQVDGARLRSGAGLAVDAQAANAVAIDVVAAAEPAAQLTYVTVDGTDVTVATSQEVKLPLNFLGTPAIMVRAHATAHLAAGYDSPSSLLALPVSTF